MAIQSNVDAFLEIKDKAGVIKGESKDKAHADLIQIQNFRWGVKMAASPTIGTGLGAGKAMPGEFEFEVSTSKASPTLFGHTCGGDHCTEATLYIRKAGGKPQDFYIWKFTDLVLTKFEVICSDDIVERISFAWSKIECEYKPQKQDGSLDSGVKSAWNVKTNEVT
jgi:type VI secretion system secreted protein Hcp